MGQNAANTNVPVKGPPATLAERRLRILVVDDDDLCRAYTRDALHDYAASITEADDGARALQILADDEYDLVVLDHNMPWVSGQQAILAIRHAGVDVPIILQTAFATDALERSLRGLGRILILHKPVEVATLRHAARAFARLRPPE